MSDAKIQAWIANEIPSQAGKKAVVTGSNSGLGLIMAEVLAAKGAHVIMACRNLDKAKEAANQIHSAVPNADLELRQLDVSSLASIADFTGQLLAEHPQIDLLLNNAGIMGVPDRQLTKDGFEAQFGTNHLGAFALTGRLLSALQAAPAARVVATASVAHRNTKGMNLDDLNFEQGGYKPFDAYAKSKLANLLFSFELDRRLKASGSSVIATSGHPGYSASNIGSAANPNGSAIKQLFFEMGNYVAMSSLKGALSMLYAACSPTLKGGEYIGPQGLMEFWGWPDLATPKSMARDPETAKLLWEKSAVLTGVEYL